MLSIEQRMNWTLPMALAWVASREMEWVEEVADRGMTVVRLLAGSDAAEIELRSKLQNGELVVRAVQEASGASAAIPKDEWAHLVLWDEQPSVALAKPGRHGLEPVYREPIVSSAEVQKLWPAPAVKLTSKQEVDCKRWLAGVIARSPDKMLMTKAKFMASDQGKGMAGRALERVWDDCVADVPAWRRRGRPSKK